MAKVKLPITLAFGACLLAGCDLNGRAGTKALGNGCLGQECFQPGDTWTYGFSKFSGQFVIPTCSSYVKGTRTFRIKSKRQVAVDSFHVVMQRKSKDSVSKCGEPWIVKDSEYDFAYFEGKSGIYTEMLEDFMGPVKADSGAPTMSVFFRKITPLDSLRECDAGGVKYKCISGKYEISAVTSSRSTDSLYYNGVGMIHRIYRSGGHGAVASEETTRLILHNGKRFD